MDKEGVWTGRIPGRSLATLMSELRSRHRGATNMFIMHAEWSDEAEAEAGSQEGGEEHGAPRRPPPGAAMN
jgi:hypothetical protein